MHLPNGTWFSKRRRRLLGLLGVAASGVVPAMGDVRSETAGTYVLRQGDRCLPLVPLSGQVPVEEFYSYQLPDGVWDGANGARDDGGPYYSSAGTRDLQRPDASLLFLYDGPGGLSLVVVHGSVESSREGGGSATFAFTGLPTDGHWVVKDDYYLDPQTGQPAESNFDRWNVGGTDQTISWTWAADGTDGGAFRGLGTDFAVGIDPAFNGAARRLEQNYEGRVTDWHLLSGDLADPDRYSLALDQPVTIQPGSCDGDAQEGKHGDGDSTRQPDEKRQTKHERTQQKHRKKREKKQQKHERKQRKHEKKREKKKRKHQRKQKKHRRKQQRKQKKHERKTKKHERKKQKHEKD